MYHVIFLCLGYVKINICILATCMCIYLWERVLVFSLVVKYFFLSLFILLECMEQWSTWKDKRSSIPVLCFLAKVCNIHVISSDCGFSVCCYYEKACRWTTLQSALWFFKNTLRFRNKWCVIKIMIVMRHRHKQLNKDKVTLGFNIKSLL